METGRELSAQEQRRGIAVQVTPMGVAVVRGHTWLMQQPFRRRAVEYE